MVETAREWDQTESCSPERSKHFYLTHPHVGEVLGASKDAFENWLGEFNRIISGHYPGDPIEQERRFQLFKIDSVYRELTERYESSVGEERIKLAIQRGDRM